MSLKKPIEQYVKQKRCPCGGKLHAVQYDKARLKRLTCKCDGLSFPHQRASKWCNDYKGEYTQEDLRGRHCG